MLVNLFYAQFIGTLFTWTVYCCWLVIRSETNSSYNLGSDPTLVSILLSNLHMLELEHFETVTCLEVHALNPWFPT